MKIFCGALACLSLLASSWETAEAAIYPETNALVFNGNIAPVAATENGLFGRQVAFKSNVVVFGNWVETSSSNNILASVFRLNGRTLETEGTLPAPALTNVAVYDLATDGGRIVLAAAENDEPALYIFQRDAAQWVLETTLHPATPLWSVSIYNGVIAVGGPGQVLVYERAEGHWNEANITPPTNTFYGSFGVDVAIDGETILVGSPGDTRGRPGGAYVYVRGETGWQLQTELPGEQFVFSKIGQSVALQGDLALVTAYPDRFNSGFVYVYKRSAGAWKHLGILTGDGGGDFFGESVAVSGRNLIVGAPSARSGGGVVHLFRYNGSAFEHFRVFREEFVAGVPGQAGSFLGNDVAVDENTIIASAPYHDANGVNAGGGAMFQFEFSPWLHSSFARFSDDSFHLSAADVRVGTTYVLEVTSELAPAEWTTVKEFQAESAETQLEVDLALESQRNFFRVRAK